MVFNYIGFDGAEWKIFHDCVGKLQGQCKSETLKKVVDRTVYGTDESDEDKEVEGKVLGGVGDEVSIMPVVYPYGAVSVSSLGYFSSVGSSSKPSHTSLPLSIRVHHIQEYFQKKIWRKRKYINPQEEKSRHE